MFLIELALVLLSLLAALVCPHLPSDWFAPAERGLARLARRRTLSVVVVGLSALGLRLALLPILPIPRPVIHDEYSYLLMADTFAHGRATNPTHPMWVHFETFQVIQHPTYASKYYPAQGIFLAVGQVLGRNSFWGVLLSVGLMCAAICWMLQGWLPSFWALLGGLLVVCRFAAFNYWANSYWGGPVAAIGGALVLGALPRIKRLPRVGDALLMGMGLALLTNSRPYESLFFCFPIATSLLIWLWKQERPNLQYSFQQFVLPLSACMMLNVLAMGFYFWRVTGSPFQTPYVVSVRTYEPFPYFPWMSVRPFPEYHDAALKDYYLTSSGRGYEFARAHFALLALWKSIQSWLFFLGPVLSLPFCMLAIVLPFGMSYKDVSGKVRFLLLVCIVSFAGMLLPINFSVHYAAPLTGAIFALVLFAMMRIRKWKLGEKAAGLRIVRAVTAICILLVLIRAAAPLAGIPACREFPRTWCSLIDHGQGRASVLDELEEQPGRNLAIVRYGPGHDFSNEWVYNDADIDNSKVVWARDMGEPKNRELMRYFKNRKVWLVEPDKVPPKLSLYVTPDLSGGSTTDALKNLSKTGSE